MTRTPSSFRFERRTLHAMLSIFCRHHHRQIGELCPACAELERYAFQRMEHCHFGEKKPNCADCPIHCYAPAMRERIIAVMRFSGPRMLRHHPLLALRHLLRGQRRKPAHPRRSAA